MKATPLRHRLKIYRQTASRSSLTGAGKVSQWEHSLTLWGQFIPLSVKDIIAGQAQDTQITARAKIRHRTDIDGKMRLQHADKMYEIVGEPLADNGSGKEYITILLKSAT